MRILVISDIHANLTALEAVLADAAGFNYQAVWCLGDLVGYGPQPNACVDRVSALPGLVCLVGNHDKAVLGEIDIATFNHDARAAIEWTRAELSAGHRDYLKSLQPQACSGDFTLVHGSPRRPLWEYILDPDVARDNFACFSTRYCLFGHTHVPIIYHQPGASGLCPDSAPQFGQAQALSVERLMINPGSVGQPRDGRPEACYALVDTAASTWEHRRAAYDIARTQTEMRTAGLPDRLITRLAVGW